MEEEIWTGKTPVAARAVPEKREGRPTVDYYNSLERLFQESTAFFLKKCIAGIAGRFGKTSGGTFFREKRGDGVFSGTMCLQILKKNVMQPCNRNKNMIYSNIAQRLQLGFF
ncbi:MAG: hypothetical protein IKQ16_09495 [Lentisphaeria bacterium]|nr:hypothetical protein [Lentisphaeria bacterium]